MSPASSVRGAAGAPRTIQFTFMAGAGASAAGRRGARDPLLRFRFLSQRLESPSPTNLRNSRGVTSAFQASRIGREYLMEGNSMERVWLDGGEWTTGSFAHWSKCNSGSCYFASVFYSIRNRRQRRGISANGNGSLIRCGPARANNVFKKEFYDTRRARSAAVNNSLSAFPLRLLRPAKLLGNFP
ncbi:hypothetical protein EVAR_75648_1 [Eumeta japonica]|uniref:Uncharacterized protein n=1 Tax=Eumeta variegata TaxID=151549 RepID=A0A4C1U1H0_EUMVA|nr:hypothetical protein EVAR_75648_1 [Eumeta japonica]